MLSVWADGCHNVFCLDRYMLHCILSRWMDVIFSVWIDVAWLSVCMDVKMHFVCMDVTLLSVSADRCYNVFCLDRCHSYFWLDGCHNDICLDKWMQVTEVFLHFSPYNLLKIMSSKLIYACFGDSIFCCRYWPWFSKKWSFSCDLSSFFIYVVIMVLLYLLFAMHCQ